MSKSASNTHGCLKLAAAFLPMIASTAIRAADITFFSWSDPHYEIEHTQGRPTVDVINKLPGTEYPASLGGRVAEPRGILIQGDLIDDGARDDLYPAQWANYTADFGVKGEGRCRFPVFDGVGNHDLHPNQFVYQQIAERNLAREKHGLIQHRSGNGYHYSWDWEDVHFVQLNLFCGNSWHGESDAYGAVHDPMNSRDFLIADLQENVGDSGRPVVIVQHFRPIDENWWTHIAADRFHKVLQDYNVILILVGHQGGGPNNNWRGIHWASSNGTLEVFRISPDNHLDILAHDSKGWGAPFRKSFFRTYESCGLPAVINNGDWATDITTTSATLGGKLIYQAEPATAATVYWGTTDGGTDPAAWQHSLKLGGQSVGRGFSTGVTGLQPWTTHYYRCAATNSKGTAWAATSISFETRGNLADGWETTFIGHEQRAGGGADLTNGSFTLRGSGRDIGEGAQGIDNFQYASHGMDGDGAITARIASVSNNTANPKVGVMMRESAAEGSRNIALLLHRSGGLRLMHRANAGERTAMSPAADATAPQWVRLVRNGNSFTGYHSADGTTWARLGQPVTLDLPPRLLVGLACTAGNRNSSSHHTVTFDQVSISGKNPE